MNERDLQVLAAVGETIKEAMSQRDELMSEKLKAATERVDLALQNVNFAVEKAAGELANQLREQTNQRVKEAVEAIQFPDFNEMLEKAVGELEMPKLPDMPDFGAMVKEAVAQAVSAIKLPEPHPLPDIKAMVTEAVSQEVKAIELPQPAKVDLDDLAIKAAELISVPQPEPLPDVPAMVKDAVAKAVAAIELPQPEHIDLEALALKASGLVAVPKAPELPDIGLMVKEAVSAIELPEPVAPDLEAIAGMVKAPDIDEQRIAKMAAGLVELPEPQEIDLDELAKQAASLVPVADAPTIDTEALVKDAAEKAALLVQIPVELVAKAAQEAVRAIELPKAPDFDAMLKQAVAAIEIPQPRPGSDGKDALQIEVLAEIDSAKSYPRGTYASHEGGLWRTYEKSHGMRGWECLMNGVAKTEIKASDDLRTVTFVNVLSDGTVTEKHFDLPVVMDRGVFKPGNTYKSGDAVTWGGSLWIAQEPTADKPGEPGAKGWRLAVKKGRDAK